VEVFDNATPPFAVDIDDNASGVGVCSRRTNGDAGGRGHDLEERTFDTDAGSDPEGVALGLLRVEVAGALDDAGHLFAAAVVRGE